MPGQPLDGSRRNRIWFWDARIDASDRETERRLADARSIRGGEGMVQRLHFGSFHCMPQIKTSMGVGREIPGV